MWRPSPRVRLTDVSPGQPPRRTFYPVAPKLPRIVTKVFVTCPKYVWAKNTEEKFQISPLVFPIWRLENGQPTKKARKSYLRGYFVSKAHKNKIPTAIPMLSGLNFSVAIIFTSPGVAITPEINMADKKAEIVLLLQVLLTS